MNVSELIDRLKSMPPDASVTHLWDGHLRTDIEIVYLARNGKVVTSDFDQLCSGNDERPEYAPSENEEPYWLTESNPNRNQSDD